jgi:hypothetical protein
MTPYQWRKFVRAEVHLPGGDISPGWKALGRMLIEHMEKTPQIPITPELLVPFLFDKEYCERVLFKMRQAGLISSRKTARGRVYYPLPIKYNR